MLRRVCDYEVGGTGLITKRPDNTPLSGRFLLWTATLRLRSRRVVKEPTCARACSTALNIPLFLPSVGNVVEFAVKISRVWPLSIYLCSSFIARIGHNLINFFSEFGRLIPMLFGECDSLSAPVFSKDPGSSLTNVDCRLRTLYLSWSLIGAFTGAVAALQATNLFRKI